MKKFLLSFPFCLKPVFAILCYQCGTDQNPRAADRCGTDGLFRAEEHSLVDCGREEANSPGQMCLKYTQLSPRAFIWDKRWKSVIRRCAQVSSHGQLQGCDWGYDSRGTYWEQCYCTKDACNWGLKIGPSNGILGASLSSWIIRLLLVER